MDLARLRAAPAAVVSRIARTQAPAEPTHSIEDVVAEARRHRPSINIGLIERANQVATQAHEGQQRASGEPYITHPVEVAYYLATLEMDAETLAAALLHDVPEDTDMTIQDIEKRFGREVGRLVDGVTKLSKFGSARSMEEQQAENIRKMFMAMAEDVRVVIIKLADRLHNMRTLGFLPAEKQARIARQSMEIYAPLAHRLGMWQIKWELEDLSFKYIEPERYRQLVEMLADRRKVRESFINKSIGILRKELGKVNIAAEISGRPKHLYSIAKKMERKGVEFDEIYDVNAIRLLVDDVKDCYAALGVVHSIWRPIPGQFDDYIAMPKANMYQSLHTAVIGPDAKPLEVQIRTSHMHDVAEAGIAAHWRYKEGSRGDRRYDEKLAWVRQLIDWQREVADATEFVEGLKLEVFQDQVFVFTPKGDVKDLPAGATPLDFAYRIHTDVGHRTIGAKANNRLVPLDYKLRNGDIVEIITTKAAHGPSRDWLSIVQTSAAREKIRQWFKRQQRDENISQGKELLDRELRRVAHETLGSVSSEKLGEIASQAHYKELDDFFAAIGYGAVSPGSVVSKLEIHDDAAITLPEVAPPSVAPSTTGVRVKGVGDLLVRFANCCSPIPGDPITGYVTRGKGVTIHRSNCPSVLSEKDIERLIDVD
ncbi:MAG TPA: bifunctional (p)ppGpp synthetase/guanosine-3',5'-bis(diphosphate) 3'-pyrophosphohydrolase, partial [Candidatus Limnocylindria bacterium]|nr:bifunctional (p)ppGpp synthetase/guanosine-3',5'-bis(diphosphate) 3'-pyrophosphohydrolase [Candidatus Limnocylindria bacterium]